MKPTRSLSSPALRLALGLALGMVAGLSAQMPAQAQAVVALVNNRPITSFDIDQRIRIAGLVERRRLDRKSALTELVDDQVAGAAGAGAGAGGARAGAAARA